MYEANSQEFKPKEGELPNTMLRFHIEEVGAKNRKFKDSDTLKVAVSFSTLLMVIFAATAWMINTTKHEEEKQFCLSS